jgi:hypothetical protein
VVALRAGSAPEVLADGTAGVLVEAEAEALAAALTDLVQDPERATLVGAAGRERYERQYTLEHMVRRVGEVLGSVSSVPVVDRAWSGGVLLPAGFAGGVAGRRADTDITFEVPRSAQVVLTCRSDDRACGGRIHVGEREIVLDLPAGGSVRRVPLGRVTRGSVVRCQVSGSDGPAFVVGPATLLSLPEGMR